MPTTTERSWKSEPRFYEVPQCAHLYQAFGMRSDGQGFFARMFFDEDTDIEAAKKVLLAHLDTFLDPNCECVMGKNCKMHKDQEVAA